MDELLYLENLRLKQMLEIAAKDICSLDGSDVNDYLHDLGTRDYYEEMEKTFDVQFISEALCVGEETVRRWIRNGDLKADKYSKKEGYIVREKDFNEFLEKHTKYRSIYMKGE